MCHLDALTPPVFCQPTMAPLDRGNQSPREARKHKEARDKHADLLWTDERPQVLYLIVLSSWEVWFRSLALLFLSKHVSRERSCITSIC